MPPAAARPAGSTWRTSRPATGGRPDRPAHLERHGRAVDNQPKPGREAEVRLDVLKRVEQFAEQVPQLIALQFSQPREQLARVGEVLGRARLEQLATAGGQQISGCPGRRRDRAGARRALAAPTGRPGG